MRQLAAASTYVTDGWKDLREHHQIIIQMQIYLQIGPILLNADQLQSVLTVNGQLIRGTVIMVAIDWRWLVPLQLTFVGAVAAFSGGQHIFNNRIEHVAQRHASLHVSMSLPLHSRPRRQPLMAASDGGIDNDDASPGTNQSRSKRPEWAPDWAPTRLVTMRPIVQLFVALLLYIFHLTVLTQHQLVFPIQLIPNDRGWAQGIGLDSLAGMASLGGMLWLRRNTKDRDVPAVPPVFRSPKGEERPWAFPLSRLSKGDKTTSNPSSGLTPRATSLMVFLMLTYTYFHTGQFSLWCERFLYDLAGVGIPLTVAMQRSLVVLMGHLGWVVAGSAILSFALRPQPFFGGGWVRPRTGERISRFLQRSTKKGWAAEKKLNNSTKEKQPADVKWYTNQWDTYWLWWSIGGYFVSSWVFNIADIVNQCVLPAAIFEAQPEGVVSQLINPENNDVAASLVGYIAPCISAPWWEEVLYRGFMLPALAIHLGYWPAVYVSGIIFSAHHMSWTGGIPLAFLGWTWAAIYAKCGNLLVTILIHAMWNSRVFLGSWLGL